MTCIACKKRHCRPEWIQENTGESSGIFEEKLETWSRLLVFRGLWGRDDDWKWCLFGSCCFCFKDSCIKVRGSWALARLDKVQPRGVWRNQKWKWLGVTFISQCHPKDNNVSLPSERVLLQSLCGEKNTFKFCVSISTSISNSLQRLGMNMRRFKT